MADTETGDTDRSPNDRTPALGRSGRDLASDSPPGEAPQGAHGYSQTFGNLNPDLFSGTDKPPEIDSEVINSPRAPHPPGAKTNPDVDPDARLHLSPTTH